MSSSCILTLPRFDGCPLSNPRQGLIENLSPLAFLKRPLFLPASGALQLGETDVQFAQYGLGLHPGRLLDRQPDFVHEIWYQSYRPSDVHIPSSILTNVVSKLFSDRVMITRQSDVRKALMCSLFEADSGAIVDNEVFLRAEKLERLPGRVRARDRR
jgi:hypothetical protein